MVDGFQSTVLPITAGAIAHDGGGGGQVAADGGKVEGSQSRDKAVKRTVFVAVPDGANAVGLNFVQLLGVVNVVTDKVGELTGGVDFSLIGGLALAQHGGGVELCPPGTGQQVAGLHEDGCSVLPGHIGPGALGGHDRLDGHFQLLFAGHAALGQHMVMVVGHGDGYGVLGEDLLAADDQRDLYHLSALALKLGLEGRPLGAAGHIAAYGLVGRLVYGEIRVVHVRSSFPEFYHIFYIYYYTTFFRIVNSYSTVICYAVSRRERAAHRGVRPSQQNTLTYLAPLSASRALPPLTGAASSSSIPLP